MKIEKIRIKNFRSFEDDIVFSPKPTLNILIGENNAGKSNIPIALDKLRKVLLSKSTAPQEPIFVSNDWYCGDNKRDIEIEASLLLEENELNELCNLLCRPSKEKTKERFNDLKNELANRVEIVLKHKLGGSESTYFKVGFLYISFNNLASLKSEGLYDSHQNLPWDGILKNFFSSNKNLENIITSASAGKENPLINFQNLNISNFLVQLFDKKLKIFEDIRQKPSGENKEVYESLDGTETADVLINLKNSDLPAERKKYTLIQKKFNDLFPTLRLEAIRIRGTRNPAINISCKDISYELPLEFMGTGITELVIFLTNLIASTGNVFFIEEPELHLHPSSQRLLLALLQEYKDDNQIFVISHSEHFVDIEDIHANTLIKIVKGKSVIKQIAEDYFNGSELSKIEKILDSENREMFFSRAVLLVEGPTEKGAMPIFAKALGKDFDKNNIFTCCVDGKLSFPIFQKILEGYGILYYIICDSDATNVKIRKKKLTIFKPDFEGVLKKYRYGKLMREAKNEVGKSKPRIGKYVAKKIVGLGKAKDVIPKEFVEAIKKIRT